MNVVMIKNYSNFFSLMFGKSNFNYGYKSHLVPNYVFYISFVNSAVLPETTLFILSNVGVIIFFFIINGV